MSKIAFKGNASGTGTLTFEAPNTNTDRTINIPDEAGTVLLAGTPTASTTNTVTTKIPVSVGGTTYYLLASTSGT